MCLSTNLNFIEIQADFDNEQDSLNLPNFLNKKHSKIKFKIEK